jgi:hypothetical protein
LDRLLGGLFESIWCAFHRTQTNDYAIHLNIQTFWFTVSAIVLQSTKLQRNVGVKSY